MTHLSLTPFSNNGLLSDMGVAGFLRSAKIKPGVILDFQGIHEVTLPFLDELFQDVDDPTAILENMVTDTLCDAVDATLDEWLRRRDDNAETPPPAPYIDPTKAWQTRPSSNQNQPTTPTTHDDDVVEGPTHEKYTPTRLWNTLKTQLGAYIESAYPLKNTALIRARRALLEEGLKGKLLSQEPYIETTPRYPLANESYLTMGLPEPLGDYFTTLSTLPEDPNKPEGDKLLYPSVFQHQKEAIESFFCARKDVIVATGTGSGKTECFLIPMLGQLALEASTRPQSFQRRAVRTLVLYPMNALVNDQLARLRLLLGNPGMRTVFHEFSPDGRHPLFGMYTSRTRYAGHRDANKDANRVAPLIQHYLQLDPALKDELERRGRYPAKDLEAFLAEHLVEDTVDKSGKARKKHHWKKRLLTGPDDSELLTRHEMVFDPKTGQGAAPDVLVTNYSMLEYMLMRPFERPIFDQTRRWLAEDDDNQFLLVIDEAHMYRGAPGAEVAFLIRRLLSRLGLPSDSPQFRAICTSASLGSDHEAQIAVTRFAADLTGKTPEHFNVITSRREIPDNPGPGDDPLAQALNAIDLTQLHEAQQPDTLRQSLQPLFEHLGDAPAPDADQEAIYATLFKLLEPLPAVHLLLDTTAGSACSLDALSQQVFPGIDGAKRATETLLTLGTLARTHLGKPGLIPTRLHMMFRGLFGLYACVNPNCDGAVKTDQNSQPLVGKLFSTPMERCDVCHSRVFELSSCRNCGTAFMEGYITDEKAPEFANHVWSEAIGRLKPIEFLPEPKQSRLCEEVLLDVRSGFIATPDAPSKNLRSVWMPRDPKTGARTHAFHVCPECQNPSLNETRRIQKFASYGEQPFTALIEAQFVEQPPQKPRQSPDKPGQRLPNQGRKVLVFSDGRQKAARLAPALETSHARDAFRQALVLCVEALQALGKDARLDLLYPTILWLCHERAINLFPNISDHLAEGLQSTEGLSLSDILNMSAEGYLPPEKQFARMLFTEFTDRFYSLWALGLATTCVNPFIHKNLLDKAPDGLEDHVREVLLKHWIRAQLEAKRFIIADISRWALGDAIYERPQAIFKNKSNTIRSRRFEAYLEHVIQDKPLLEKTRDWFHEIACKSHLTRVFGGDGARYLRPKSLVLKLRLNDDWMRCQTCNRLSVDHINMVCPSCTGTLESVSAHPLLLDARSGFFRQKILRALRGEGIEPYGLTAMEHSAQLSGIDNSEAYARTEEYELRFQDIPIKGEPPIDVLSCTTTMEVGIDIGQLSAVALRNVPPHVANYQQRAGRAGRRGTSIASVITYAQGGSHDAHYFDNPAHMISGETNPPLVYVENADVLRRHIHAFLVQSFFHETVAAHPKRSKLFEALGNVEHFLNPDEDCSFAKMEAWLHQHRDALIHTLRQWVPVFSHGRGEAIDNNAVIESSVDSLLEAIRRDLPFDLYAQGESLSDAQNDVLHFRLRENLLQTLLDRAILPRYAFPTDVVTLYVMKRERGAWSNSRVPEFDYTPSRDLQIALSEYAPGRELTIDKKRYTTAAIYSPYMADLDDMIDNALHYLSCPECGYVEVQKHAIDAIACPVCAHIDLFRQRFVVPTGFAPDVNEKPKPDLGGSVRFAGFATKAQLEFQNTDDWPVSLFEQRLRAIAKPHHLVMVNKGVDDRGFFICSECGRTEPRFGRGFTKSKLFDKAGNPQPHLHPTQRGVHCQAAPQGPFFLGHRFLTDVLVLRMSFEDPFQCSVSTPAGRAALTTLAEALCLAASRVLNIENGEIAAHWSPVKGHDGTQADIFIYDRLAGGAGYAREIGHADRLEAVFQATDQLLDGCTCDASCYECLRHYQNQREHGLLDRKLALALLRHITQGALPDYDPADIRRMLSSLEAMLDLRGVSYQSQVNVQGLDVQAEVPLIIHIDASQDVWLEVHHPFVKCSPDNSEVWQVGMETMEIVEVVDGHTLTHHLPDVSAALEKKGLP